MFTYLLTFIKVLKAKVVFELVKLKHGKPPAMKIEEKNKAYLAELKDKGYCVVENYLDPEQCKRMCTEIDQVIGKYPDAVWSGHLNADQRVFGIEHANENFYKFYSDSTLTQVGEAYFNGQLSNLQTLAGKILYKEGNKGSGEGWHRDGNNFQYKTIVYLSDVSSNNGPFQIVEKSNNFFQILSDMVFLKRDIENTRFTAEEIDRLIASAPERLKTFTAKAGTLLFVDTSLIHRGAPIKEDKRYALTNYFYPSYLMHIYEGHFMPRLTKEMVK